MPKPSRTVQVTLQLSAKSLKAYDQALQLLRQKLGFRAPDFVTLIQHELADRDPHMIADDFLETQPRSSTHLPQSPPPPTRKPLHRRQPFPSPPNDPSSN